MTNPEAPDISNMCPVVAMAVKLAQEGQLNTDTAAVLRQVSALMTQLAEEERRDRLVQLDEWLQKSRGVASQESVLQS